MNSALVSYPECRELLQAIAELSLISHASTQQFDPVGRDTAEDIGGRRPSGGDMDRPGRNASSDERQAWWGWYQRKTPDYFRREIDKCETVERLVALRDECRDVVKAWKVGALGGEEPVTRADPRWKRFVYESTLDAGVLAHRFGVTRRYINMVRQREGILVWLEERERVA